MASRQRREEGIKRRRKPATTPAGRERELTSMAMDRAEEQLRDGTASSQVITHFLKVGSTREQLEQERIRHENELLRVKREHLESAKRTEELYEEALGAMKLYQGRPDEIEDDYDEG